MKLKPGCYALRYSCDGGEGPVATIGYAPRLGKGEAFVIGPRRGGQVVLDASEAMALVYVEGDEAALDLTVFIPDGYPEKSVRLDVERLDADAQGLAIPANQNGELLNLSGHVEMVGDTDAATGHWLGAQSGEARIEGFTVHWPGRPLNIDLSYGCTVSGLGKSPASLTGGFVGTRRRAAPITSVWAELKGDEASQYDLIVNAAFSKRGKAVGGSGDVLHGLGPNDYLVGLNVSLLARQKLESRRASGTGGARANASPIQTFRAK